MVGKGFFLSQAVGWIRKTGMMKIKYSHADVKVDFGGEFIYFRILVEAYFQVRCLVKEMRCFRTIIVQVYRRNEATQRI